MAFLDVVKDKCSKLKQLSVYVIIPRGNTYAIPLVSYSDKIFEHVVYAKGKIQEIVEKCRLLVSNLQIHSILLLTYRPEREVSYEWIEQAKAIDWFKDAIPEQALVRLADRPHHVRQLSSKFYDGFLELDHKTKVYRALPE